MGTLENTWGKWEKEINLKKGEKYDLKTFLKINHNLFFVAYCENIDLFLFQRSFTVITFIYPRQESSSNHTSINFSFVRTLVYE